MFYSPCNGSIMKPAKDEERTMTRRDFLAGGAAAALVGSHCGVVLAQDYPAKPVKILVSTAAGGMADTLGRLLASHLTNAMGQQFYVENRGGAGNIIGIDLVAKSPADGYTFLVCAASITSNHILYRKLPYDVVRDLVPISQLVSLPNVLVVHPAHNINTLAEYVAAARKNPGKLNFASAGVGSNLHLSMELLRAKTGIDVVHVPYKGVGPAMSDLLGGHVASMFSNAASAKPHIDSGKLRALGVTSARRAPALPDVPSIAEAGIKDYEVLNWFGMFAPIGTPEPIVARVYGEIAKLFAMPETQKRFAREGADIIASAPSDFARFAKSEIAQWTEVGRAAKIQPAEQ
jgi:tripartite-type tricarboxylate transporter receptor subunit TctC